MIAFRDVRITEIEIFKLNVPLSEPFVISLGTITDANNLVVKLHTNAGLTGTGESCPYIYIVGETQASNYEMARQIARLWKRQNPLEIEARLTEMNRAVAYNYTVKSAFDMALFDLLGKYSHLPVYALLGGKNDRKIHTDMTVSIGDPAKMAADALKFKQEGFPAIKVKLGGTRDDDVARIRAIREAVGSEIPLRIDANQGWDCVTAIATLKALAPYDIEHCEEPVPHWNNRDLARVRAESPIPVMADESLFDHHDAFRLASIGACDYFNIKLSKSGGIQNALRIIAVAESCGLKSQIGVMSETRYAVTALCHLALARKNIIYFDLDSPLMLSADPVTGGMEYFPKGEIRIPDAPGFGADFDADFLAEMERVVV
ncbi:MAG: dipeptide epimerase [Calditrichaeota bacterium]|nr:dipeptide epimerase [Calditrichota bacterium]